jgi:hypothetical protein
MILQAASNNWALPAVWVSARSWIAVALMVMGFR